MFLVGRAWVTKIVLFFGEISMLRRTTLAAILVIGLSLSVTGLGKDLKDNYNDLLHYTMIGRFDLAKGYAQAILDAGPDPVEMLELSKTNQQGYALLIKAAENTAEPQLAALCKQILDIIEQGRFTNRADPKIIVEEIKRLSSTSRAKMEAVKRLQNAGEYAIMYMLDALADETRKEEVPNITWAMSRMGRDSVRPLVAAMQTDNVAVKAEMVKSLGKIGYPQSAAYLKFIVEKDDSPELRRLAEESIKEIDAGALKTPAAQLFYRLAENYYYHAESLAPAEDANFANVWFWDGDNRRLAREEVDKRYFNELMAMRNCEWALKADAGFGQAIGLWLASYFKAESPGVDMPHYFGQGHADAMTYATTAGPEYLHQALARAVGDKDASVAIGIVEALSTTAGESSLFYRVGPTQPLAQALSFDSKAVRYSAAIAVAAAGPKEAFPESKIVVQNLAEAIAQSAEQVSEDSNRATAGHFAPTSMWNAQLADSYALRAAKALLKLAQTRNRILDLSLAQNALIASTKDKRPEIQMLSGQILAYLNNAAAQGAIAAMALDENNSKDIRISGFNSLAVSAQLNANLLDDAKIDAIYSLVASKDAEVGLRAAAAAAYGALNLPSQKVKNLILDQARS